MKEKLTPEDLQNEQDFELLSEVQHSDLRVFVMEQVLKEKNLVRLYSAYQISMILLFIFFLIKAFVLWGRAITGPLINIGFSLLFSFSLLVIIHELVHALANLLTGTRRISFGAIWKKFIFYVVADKQVIDPVSFRFIALAPLVLVKILCLVGAFVYRSEPTIYFFLSVMCIHSLFCAGDIAMLAFYNLYPGKSIYNYDDVKLKKTFFYIKK